MRQWNNFVYKNSWRWTCKCPKHEEAIYENKIIVKFDVSVTVHHIYISKEDVPTW